MTEHKQIAYYHGLQAAKFRLNSSSFGYDPNYNFKAQAKRLFTLKDEINDFLQAIEDYKNQLAKDTEEVS